MYGYVQLLRNLHGLYAEVADECYQHRTIGCRCCKELMSRRLGQARHDHAKEEGKDYQNAKCLKGR